MNKLTIFDKVGGSSAILLGMAVIVELILDRRGFEWVHAVISLTLIVGGAYWLRPTKVKEAIDAASPLARRN